MKLHPATRRHPPSASAPALARRRALLWRLLPLPWLGTTGAAHGQDFPSRGLHLTVPYPAGGTVDLLARQLAAALRPALRQEVRVENLPGAAGALGLQKLLQSAADGHELALATDSDAVLVPLVNPQLRYRTEQLRLIGLVARSPMVLVAGAGLQGAELAPWLAEARRPAARPAVFGSYGVGSNSHLCAEDFQQRTGLIGVHLPYKGIAPLLQDLLGGHVDLAFLPLAGGIHEAVAAGRLRALGLAAAERDARLPQLPTLAQALGLGGFVHHSWAGLVVPAAVPDAVAQRLAQELQDTLRSAEFQQTLLASGSQPAPPMDLAQAQQLLLAEVERYRPLAARWLSRSAALSR